MFVCVYKSMYARPLFPCSSPSISDLSVSIWCQLLQLRPTLCSFHSQCQRLNNAECFFTAWVFLVLLWLLSVSVIAVCVSECLIASGAWMTVCSSRAHRRQQQQLATNQQKLAICRRALSEKWSAAFSREEVCRWFFFQGSSVRLERMCTLHQELGEEEDKRGQILHLWTILSCSRNAGMWSQCFWRSEVQVLPDLR